MVVGTVCITAPPMVSLGPVRSRNRVPSDAVTPEEPAQRLIRRAPTVQPGMVEGGRLSQLPKGMALPSSKLPFTIRLLVGQGQSQPSGGAVTTKLTVQICFWPDDGWVSVIVIGVVPGKTDPPAAGDWAQTKAADDSQHCVNWHR